MTVEQTYSNGMGALAPNEKGFTEKLYFNASGNVAEQNAAAEALADVRKRFPYPPTSCDDATIKVNTLDDLIKSTNEAIASAATNRVGKRYLTAYQGVRNEFQAYINASQCVQKALASDSAAFDDQWQSLLNKEQTTQATASTSDNWIIFGALGLLFVGAMFIIFKKSKPVST